MALNEKRDFESIGIVGGGISGLYAAWLLTRALGEPEYAADGRSRRIVLLETSDRLGGRIETIDFSTEAAAPEDCGCCRLLAEPADVDLDARRFANHETECTVVPG